MSEFFTSQDSKNAKIDAQTIDNVANSSSATTQNRFGYTLQTIQGALTNFGYEPPNDFVSDSPFLVDRPQQTTFFDGNNYAPKIDQLPFNTTGVFDENQWYLVTVGSNKVTANLEVTVGAGGDFLTVNEAVASLVNRGVGYETGPVKATIRLLTGFIMAEQIIYEGLNLGWIEIVGDDAETTIDISAITETVNTTDRNTLAPVFSVKRGVLPVIRQNFIGDGVNSASGKTLIILDNSRGNVFDVDFNGTGSNDFDYFCYAVNSNLSNDGSFDSATSGQVLINIDNAYYLLLSNLYSKGTLTLNQCVFTAINTSIDTENIDSGADIVLNMSTLRATFMTSESFTLVNSNINVSVQWVVNGTTNAIIASNTNGRCIFSHTSGNASPAASFENCNIDMTGSVITSLGAATVLSAIGSRLTIRSANISGPSSPSTFLSEGSTVYGNGSTTASVNVADNTLTSDGIYFKDP